MIKKKTIMQEVEVVEMYCDACGKKKVGSSIGYHQCEYCKKLLCNSCVGHIVQSTGDYDEYWCQSCWDKGEKYRTEIEKLENKVDELYDQWEKECLEEK